MSGSHLCIPRNETVIFENRITMFCLPVPTLINRHMNVETGTEAAQISEKEYINGIFIAMGQIV